MANRTVRFETHIIAIIREMDRREMMFRFDLWSYDVLKENFSLILTHLKGEPPIMPPKGKGGPWPDEWIALFERWGNKDGFARLERATATEITATREGPGQVRIRVQGELPSPAYGAWLDWKHDRETPFEFVLFREADEDSRDEPEPIPFDEGSTYPIPDSVTRVTVYDGAGPHRVTITA
jgi:hypothetical protein